MCELVRVLGVAGVAAEFEPAVNELAVTVKLPFTSAASRGYLFLAAGRAWVQVGAPERSLACLDDAATDWALARRDADRARRRRQARALAATGAIERTAAIRAYLGREPDLAHDLAALDAALAGADSPLPEGAQRVEEKLAAVVARDPQLMAAILAPVGTDPVVRGRCVAERYPY